MLYIYVEVLYGIFMYFVIGLGGFYVNEVLNFFLENIDIFYRLFVKFLIVLNFEVMFFVDFLDEVLYRGRGGVGMLLNFFGGNGICSYCVR